MAEEQDKTEEQYDFTPDGETLGYISLDHARVLAMRIAKENPGDYGRRFAGVSMAFEVVEDEDTEDHYVITLSFRPQGQFIGAPGQEQFFIENEGNVAHRQVMALPRPRRHYPVIPVAIGLAVAGVVVAIILLALEEFG